MIPSTMHALRISAPTPASRAQLTHVPVPAVRPGWALVHVRGFGMNHSEKVLRDEEITCDYIAHPIIPGIECVGHVADPSDTRFTAGQKVCALMGGMGRNWDGSYAKYCLVPESHLFALPEAAAALPWEVLAAVPETFYTAWGSLFEGLHLAPQDTLLVRAASCGLGYAALQIAHAHGCRAIATTHRPAYVPLLERFGADQVILDREGVLAGSGVAVDKVLELSGPATLNDSLRLLRPGGICCDTGILGGRETLAGWDPITAIPNGCYLTGFYSNSPTQQVIDALFTFVAQQGIRPFVARTFAFSELPRALALQDAGGFQGKLVVVNDR